MPWSAVQLPTPYYTAIYSAQANGGAQITGVRMNAFYNQIDGVHTEVDITTSDAGDIDIAAGNEAIREFLATGTLPSRPNTVSDSFGYSYQSFKTNDSLNGETSRTLIEVRETIASFDSTGAETFLPDIPDALLSITTPWGPNPDTGAYVRYQELTGTFAGWAGQSGGGDWHPNIFGSGLTEPMTAHFMIRDYINSTSTGSTTTERFHQASDGVTLADCFVDPSGGVPVVVDVPLDAVALMRKFSMLVLPGQLVTDTFSFPNFPMPIVGSSDNRAGSNLGSVTQALIGHTSPPIYAVCFTPGWQYWIPDTAVVIPPPLRFNQRDDGLGATAGHARLITGQPNGAQSGQLKTAPRLNSGNIYDPGVQILPHL